MDTVATESTSTQRGSFKPYQCKVRSVFIVIYVAKCHSLWRRCTNKNYFEIPH